VKLEQTCFTDSALIGAAISGTTFAGCHFEDFEFNAKGIFRRGKIEGTQFRNCHFRDVKMSQCSFVNVKLMNLDIADAKLKDLDWQDLTIDGNDAFWAQVKKNQ
jgi:uncharacterized protein YjbI with pentapeptide repeats